MAYTTGGIPQVIRTYPANLAKDIEAKAQIQVEFSTDIDIDYIEDNLIVSTGDGTRLSGSFVYGQRLLTFTPTKPFVSLETIRITLVGDDLSGKNIGIRSVLGTKMKGNYMFSFTIAATPLLRPPVLVYPTNGTAIDSNPRFDWKSIKGADHYQIQVAQTNIMNPIVWPPKWEEFKVFDTVLEENITVEDGTYYIIRETIDPTVQFKDGLYYWRMRSVSADGVVGEWTELHTFYIDKEEEGVVSDEDEVPGDIIEFDEVEDEILEILAVFPEDAFSNVATNLKTVYIHVLGEYTKDTLDASIFLTGEPVDGDDSDPAMVHGNVSGEIEIVPQGDGTTIIAFIMEPLEVVE